ncbi:MAG TPA: PQQ-dependent sugar dehydrogenase [Pyrinomonadaceae bacterium]|nr:PQQ-dependent sugar dehydrogenase [Pyrinomonadaceae bacterium]
MNGHERRGARAARAEACARWPPAFINGPRAKSLFALALAVALYLAGAAARAQAATLPPGFSETQVAIGLGPATAMAFAPDGRIFVCQQHGHLRVVKNGSLLPTPFLSLTVDSQSERGLLGVAFDPNFASNRFVYVYYTATEPTVHNRISRFTASAANPDVAEEGSEVVVLELETLGSTIHNGGAMHFGADGRLYVAVGDGGLPSHAQSYANKLGKILRINPDPANLIPADNPFLDRTAGTNQAIWALGLRNPYTFAVQPGTGRIFVNDVGQNTWEEINDVAGGANYGWPSCEGNCPVPSPTPTVRPPNTFTDPVFQYPHRGAQPAGCAITGGTFYNPTAATFPAEYVGKYFFVDYCSGFIRYIDPSSPSTSVEFATGISFPLDLKVASDGSLWYLERGGSPRLMRVAYAAGTDPPSIAQHPQSQTVAEGVFVTFTVVAEGSGTLLYRWQRDGADIPGATSQSYTINSADGDSGVRFRAVVTNPFGSATSDAATLTVTPNTAPSAQINSPNVGTTYAAGDTVNFSGAGSDAQDGQLPPSAFTWRVDFHHDDHTHPFVAPFSGATSGSFTIPVIGETSANVFYRVHLSVTDSRGAPHQVFRDVTPRTAAVTLRTDPAGLQLTLDGQPRADGYSETNVVNIQRTLGAPVLQTVGGITYSFVSWSDGGAATRDVNVPAAGAAYTAKYIENRPPSITQHPPSRAVDEGASVTFAVAAEGSGTLGYRWQRDGADIPGATSQSYTISPAVIGDSGAKFRAVVTNAFGSATSDAATLTVTPNTPPMAQINSPAAGASYAAGDTISFSGSATDAQDGQLSASALTWRVDFHHDDHTHPFVAPFSGATSGSFTAPATGETSANVFYRIHLSVTDSRGASHQVFRDVTPRTATVTLRTNPDGLQLTLDGQPRADGYSETNVVNMRRTLGAPPSQMVGGVSYDFVSWSDGGALTHNVNAPAADTTYTASYARRAEAGEVIISEFRLDGPAGATDEFVELHNRADRDITVAAADGSAGWALVTARIDTRAGPSVPIAYHVIPAGTVIRARSRYLVAGGQYSLAGYGGPNAAAPDATTAEDLTGEDSSRPFGGLGLFRTTNPSAFVAEHRLDAVGCGLSLPLLVEGSGVGLCVSVGTAAQNAADYSLVRRLNSGEPQDTGDNAADFQLVAAQFPFARPPAGTPIPAALGAPGPENSNAPGVRASLLRASLIQPRARASQEPNRVRDLAAVANGAEGTLSVRRRYTNKTGATVTRLRFRITYLSTAGNRADNDADLRALSSNDLTVTGVAGEEMVLRGTTLEGPPAQAQGGGINSTLSADSVSLASPLQPGQSISLQFLFGVQTRGNFRLLVNVEALP